MKLLKTFIMVTSMASLQAKLVSLTELVPTLKLDLRYATANNFTGKQVYPDCAKTHCYLEEHAAQALVKAQQEFLAIGYCLKVFDAYRPRSAQEIFWQLVPDERYVINPANGSRHTRGCAIDVTLVDKDGKELDMGTEFDDFTERAHIDCKDLSETVQTNRTLLHTVMAKHGFEVWYAEWWHFDFKGWKEYALHTATFEELCK